MFGFGRLASYDYFVHLERALLDRLRTAGDDARAYVAEVSPTASIRRRAACLSDLVSRTDQELGQTGVIHLVGHSTGGLDARLVASPDAAVPCTLDPRPWLSRLASVTTLNAPHFGTPLASFFATVSGQRMLEALSALTFIALSLGSPPLAAASTLVLAFARVDRALGLDVAVLDRSIDALLNVLDDARSREVRLYLNAIRSDQGSVIQLSPEAMDLFQAGVGDRPGVLYQCTASMAPPPSPRTLRDVLVLPWTLLSKAIFATLHGVSSRNDERYPCSATTLDRTTEDELCRVFDSVPGVRSNDGVVPLRSQLWGKLVWAGYGDHLDVLGHFHDDAPKHERSSLAIPHVDWLSSGSGFGRRDFSGMVDAIARGLLAGTRRITVRPAR
jgi:hypothetical protein